MTRSGTARIDGCNLAWREKGTGSPVLFVHGTAADVWGGLFDRVAASCRAIRYDRRGFGASAHRPVQDLSRHATDAAGLLAALDATGAIVVGWSIGAIIAAEVAARHAALVRGLVLLEPPLWAKKSPNLNLLNGVVFSIVLGLVAGPARGGARFSRWVFGERNGVSSLEGVDEAVRRQIVANAAAIGVEIRAGTGEHLSPAELSTIRVPTVVISGDRSHKFFAKGSQQMATAIPGARLHVLPGASHLLQIEREKEIALEVLALTSH